MLHAAPRCSLRERMPAERRPPGLEERSGELAVSCKEEDGRFLILWVQLDRASLKPEGKKKPQQKHRLILQNISMLSQAAEDVNVTFEDQQKINKFARNTSRITELKEEIEVKKKQLQNLEDACEDIMLADDDCLMIPYQIGDVFISHSQEETQEMLEEAKKNLQEEIDALESRVESIQRVLADLKVQLYAKFGSNINLEADES
ncbi:hypothetical protein E5288_WYG012995 [Bos mutus]|uniref:Prefoldin subunit 4 n=2 Tax=Bos mutus TaxID=72004 RepID=A0A6B0RC93_9CETA|nr:hypothetical protein [Bos mutus]